FAMNPEFFFFITARQIVKCATGCIIVGKIHASQDPGNYMKLSLLLSGRRYVQFIEVACQTEKQSSMVYHQKTHSFSSHIHVIIMHIASRFFLTCHISSIVYTQGEFILREEEVYIADTFWVDHIIAYIFLFWVDRIIAYIFFFCLTLLRHARHAAR
ncbi:hypothetical protein ACJX0J_007199, partial [Zea mays]